MKKHIPNFITCLNLFTGCVATVYAFNGELETAAYLVLLAAAFDFMDGLAARVLKAYSEIGKQLDSLADMVSFGFIPGLFVFKMLPTEYAYVGFIITVFSALRLAKFNIDSTQQYGFKGVPTPGVGLLIASFPLMLHYGGGLIDINQWLINQWVLYALIVLLSWLMVSNLSILSLKFENYTVKSNLPKLILLLVAVVALPILHWLAIPVIFIAYIILSLQFKNKSTT
jgi:CDP-diacylglycerol--serine O-phosphatidyltransferase